MGFRRLLAFRSPCSDAAAWPNLSTFDIFAAHPCLRSPHCWTCRQVGRLWQCLQLYTNGINVKETAVYFTCLCSRWSSLRPYPTRMSRMVEKAVLPILQSCCCSVQLFLAHTVSETVERRFSYWLKSPDFSFSMHKFFSEVLDNLMNKFLKSIWSKQRALIQETGILTFLKTLPEYIFKDLIQITGIVDAKSFYFLLKSC